MCYNYEYMNTRAEKRSAREESFSRESLTETEQQLITYHAKRLSTFNEAGSDELSNETAETISSFPGQQTIIIPITTKQRESYIFGFLPDWAKSLKDAKANYNCRTETILEKPTWKNAFTRAQRCLVLAAAFYETDRATKKRYRFTVKEEPEIFFAGIFNHWADKETGELHKTFAIITCAANDLVATVWERMPVILNYDQQQIWMNIESAVDECNSILRSYPADAMELTEAPPLLRKKKSDPNLNLEF